MTKAMLLASAAALTLAAPASAEKWDMPMAYSGSNFHSENGAVFAQCVTDLHQSSRVGAVLASEHQKEIGFRNQMRDGVSSVMETLDMSASVSQLCRRHARQSNRVRP